MCNKKDAGYAHTLQGVLEEEKERDVGSRLRIPTHYRFGLVLAIIWLAIGVISWLTL